MRKTKLISAIALLAMLFVCSISMLGCSSDSSGGTSIVGTWHEEDYEWESTFTDIYFYEDGTCRFVPMSNSRTSRYYEVYEDGMLVVMTESGSSCSYARVMSEYEALDDEKTYYLSGDKLIIRENVYVRRK